MSIPKRKNFPFLILLLKRIFLLNGTDKKAIKTSTALPSMFHTKNTKFSLTVHLQKLLSIFLKKFLIILKWFKPIKHSLQSNFIALFTNNYSFIYKRPIILMWIAVIAHQCSQFSVNGKIVMQCLRFVQQFLNKRRWDHSFKKHEPDCANKSIHSWNGK